MKCPKCGAKTSRVSANAEVYCPVCKCYRSLLKTHEPTTAEKLLMLTNYCETVSHSRYFRDIYLTTLKDKTNISKGFWYGEDEDYKTITEAIDAAYNWAKEQEK